jgi:hypothetical protein
LSIDTIVYFISVPGKHNDHDHDVADEPQDEDPEVGHKEQEDHARGHDQRLLDLVTADKTGNTWLNHHSQLINRKHVLGSSQLIKQETRAWVITADQTGNTCLGHHS